MAGQLWGWGRNGYFGTDGALGDNTSIHRSSPVQTIAGGTNWKSFSCGGFYTAAIKTDGTLWTWGGNNASGYLGPADGALGDNTTISKSSPVQTIAGGTNWNSVACGKYHVAAIKTDGTLWLWGGNNGYGPYGQLGDNTVTNRSSPVQTISGGTNWSSVSCGYGHTAAIKTDGTLWTWGFNLYAQLGDNTLIYRSSPVQVFGGGTNWSSVSCGNSNTAAIKTDGTLWVWGANDIGMLGDNTTTHKSSPVQTVAGGTNWNSVACGATHIVATKTDGTLWLWGGNYYGQLGDNTKTHRSSPIQIVAGDTNWSRIACGQYHTTTIKKDGTLWTWGLNNNGQLGDNAVTNRSSPVQTIMGGTRWYDAKASTSTFAIYENSPTALSVTTQPAVAYEGQNLVTQPVLNLLDSGNNLTTLATNPVTASVVSGTLSIGGTTTVAASGGVAAFTDLSLNGVGNASILFTSSGLTSAITGPLFVKSPVAVMPKRSETASSVPTSGQLKVGELAINIADQKGYVKKSDGTIVNVFTGLTSGIIQNYMIASGAIIPDGGTF